jgi:hypothetical protein
MCPGLRRILLRYSRLLKNRLCFLSPMSEVGISPSSHVYFCFAGNVLSSLGVTWEGSQ